MKRLGCLGWLFLISTLHAQTNVLMIVVDDLKPIWGAYGHPKVKAPRLDKLCAEAVVFHNAHCQQAVCGPSRASLLTGKRPDYTKVWDLNTRMRDKNPEILTLPQYFKEKGYISAGTGKIFDYRCVDGKKFQDEPSWSMPFVQVEENPMARFGFLGAEFVKQVDIETLAQKAKGMHSEQSVLKAIGGMPAYESTENVSDAAYEDGKILEAGQKLLRQLSSGNKPFFLAVGFKKPHLPFVAPKKYWDLYAPEELELPTDTTNPVGAPAFAMQDSWELKNGQYRIKEKNKQLDRQYQLKLLHGYYACVSYVDALIGQLLEELSRLNLDKNTIVILWGDHGFHLGDHGMWGKHTNYEQSTHSPLILKIPGQKATTSNLPVEFIDVFPTLCELSGLPMPQGLDGLSLVPVLQGARHHKDFAVSQFPRHYKSHEIMGYAFRDERYRYIEWVDNHFFENAQQKGEVVAIEFYDYLKDPLEEVNVAHVPEYKEQMELLQQLARTSGLARSK